MNAFFSRSVLSVAAFLLTTAAPAQTFQKVDNWLQENIEELGGRAFLAVYKDGRIVHTQAVNEMSRRQKTVSRFLTRRQGKEANTDDYTITTRQPIASCSKWLSAALVMTFVDEGKLKLTDTVGQWLPTLSAHGKGGITIEQCLSHRTGIKAASLRESLQQMRTIGSMDEAIEKIATLPVEGAPGTVFRYSNAGLQIAGAVIERISGKDFEALFAERIARPLAMKNTDFGKGRVPLPAGGAFSTPEDYLNFLVMMLNKGLFNGRRILKESSIAAMQVNRLTPDIRVGYSPAQGGNWGYGFGEWVMDENRVGNLSAAVSSPGLFGSFPWVENKRQYCAFLMTYNLKNEGRGEKYRELKALVDEALK